MKRALITGASSYIGHKLAQYLAAHGIEVHAVIRPQTDATRLPACLGAANLHSHDGSTESLVEIVARAKPDVTFHLAGLYLRETTPEQVLPLIASNYTFGIQLLEALRISAARPTIVYAGTYSQYFMSETPRPLNLYSALKQAFSEALSLYLDQYGFRTIELVLFDNFGVDDWRPKLIRALADAARNGTELPMPDEDVTIDLMHIDDVTEAFAYAAQLLENDRAAIIGKTFAVSSGARYRLTGLVALFESIIGRSVATRQGAYTLPVRRISVPWTGPRLPGWEPKIKLEDGIRSYVSAQD